MKSRRLISVSLPDSLIKSVDKLSAREDRSRSSFVRLALIDAIGARLPQVEATPSEKRSLALARKEHREGKTIPLNEVLHELNLLSATSRKKATRKTATKTTTADR